LQKKEKKKGVLNRIHQAAEESEEQKESNLESGKGECCFSPKARVGRVRFLSRFCVPASTRGQSTINPYFFSKEFEGNGVRGAKKRTRDPDSMVFHGNENGPETSSNEGRLGPKGTSRRD